MPIMDGYEATRAIRALRDYEKANIPILAMTANAFAEDKIQAFRCGMNAHIAKPIDVAELKENKMKQKTHKERQGLDEDIFAFQK